MNENIILRKNPKIEFQFHESGFNLIDVQTKQNSGFYAYSDLRSIELNNVWFPKLANWLRVITSIFNGVPFFPDAETYKKANLIFHHRKAKLGIWLTDTSMANKAKKLEKLLVEKTKNNNA